MSDDSQSLERWLTTPTDAKNPAVMVEDGVGITADGSPPPQHWAEMTQSVEIRAVILRACTTCGGKTELVDGEAQCPQHGRAPTVDLGVVNARYRWRLDPRRMSQNIKKIQWALTGRRASRRRILTANEAVR